MVLITEIVVLIERDFVDRRVLEIVRYGLVRCDDDATDDRRGAGDRKQCGIGPWASELLGCRAIDCLLTNRWNCCVKIPLSLSACVMTDSAVTFGDGSACCCWGARAPSCGLLERGSNVSDVGLKGVSPCGQVAAERSSQAWIDEPSRVPPIATTVAKAGAQIRGITSSWRSPACRTKCHTNSVAQCWPYQGILDAAMDGLTMAGCYKHLSLLAQVHN